MKKTFLVTLIALLLASSGVAIAQNPPTDEFNFQRAYEDFVFSYDQYRTQHSDYQLARSQYIQSQTLAARSKAQQETYEMLSARDEVVKTYLTALRMRLSEAVGIPQDRLQILYAKIDTEVAWFEGHKSTLSSAASLEDQVKDSNIAKNRYDSISLQITYEILSEIAKGKEYVLRQKEIALLTDLKNKLSSIRGDEDIDVSRFERDLLEVENRISRSEGKQADVDKSMNDLMSSRDPAKSLKLYNDIQFRLRESLQYLKEANNFLRQIITIIKLG